MTANGKTARLRATRIVAAMAVALLLATAARGARADLPLRLRLAAVDTETPREATPTVPAARPTDDGPAGASLEQRERMRAEGSGQGPDDRPFWKSWVFWVIAGAVVVGGTALAVHSFSGSSSTIEPCPGAIVASQGCYGAGSGR